MAEQDDRVQVPMRLPRDLVDRIDDRAARVGEKSRNALVTRMLEWAVAQPVRTDRAEVRT